MNLKKVSNKAMLAYMYGYMVILEEIENIDGINLD